MSTHYLPLITSVPSYLFCQLLTALKLVDKMSRARKTTRSAFIRDALEAKIQRERILEAETRHAEGYAQKPVAAGEFDGWLSEQDWGGA